MGQTLQVPGPAPARSTAPATKKAQPKRTAAKRQAPARRTLTHRVAPSDNLMHLAARYDTSWRAIMKANGLSDARHITTGSTLRIPVPTAAAQKTKAPATTKAPQSPTSAKAATSTATKANTFLGRTYSDAVVARAARNRATLRHADVPSRSETRALIVRTAQRYGVNPRLALGIAWQESGWNQRAVSVANAVGVMQVMPGTGEWCSTIVGRELNLLDARDNVTAGVVFLRWLTQHADHPEQAIAGYFQGLGGVKKKGMYPDTLVYVASVTSHMARF